MSYRNNGAVGWSLAVSGGPRNMARNQTKDQIADVGAQYVHAPVFRKKAFLSKNICNPKIRRIPLL